MGHMMLVGLKMIPGDPWTIFKLFGLAVVAFFVLAGIGYIREKIEE